MPLATFIATSILARGLRFFIVAGLLWKFGAPIRDFIEKRLGLVTIAFVVLLFGGFLHSEGAMRLNRNLLICTWPRAARSRCFWGRLRFSILAVWRRASCVSGNAGRMSWRLCWGCARLARAGADVPALGDAGRSDHGRDRALSHRRRARLVARSHHLHLGQHQRPQCRRVVRADHGGAAGAL